MMSIKTLIVCMSVHHQNTARVAQAIGGVLHADCCNPDEATTERIRDYELIGFDSGIYFGQFHESLRRCIDEIRLEPNRHSKSFLFSTEGLPVLWQFWHWPLRTQLRKKGFDVIGEFHCSGFDTVGPLGLIGGLNRRRPNDRDLKRAEHFAHNLLQKMCNVDSVRSS